MADPAPWLRAHRVLTRTPVVALLYTVVAIAATWPLATQLGTRLASDLGDPAFNAWVIGWDAGQILAALQGNLDALRTYWNGNIFHPEPLTLTYSEHLTAQAIQILPIWAATGNLLIAYNVLFISTFVGSALAVFLLVRDLTGRPLAGFLAGLAYVYAPYRLGQFAHIQVMSGYWMPLALLGFHRYFTRVSAGQTGRRLFWPLAGAAAAIVAQNLSCGYFMLFFAPFAAAYALYEIVQRRLIGRRRVWVHLSIAAAAVALVTWPFVEPYFRLRASAGMGVRPLSEIVTFSADTHAFASAASRTKYLGRWMPGFIKAEGEGFPGFTILLFAAIGLVWGLRRAVRDLGWSTMRDWQAIALAVSGLVAVGAGAVVLWFFVNGQLAVPLGGRTVLYQQATTPLQIAGAAALACLSIAAIARRGHARPSAMAFGYVAVAALAAALFALGPRIEAGGKTVSPGPYLWLFEYVPGYDGLRVPARFLMLVALFLAVLAGFGVAALAALRRPALSRLAVAAGTMGILLEGCVTPFETNLPVRPGAGLLPAPGPRSGSDISPIYDVVRTLPGPLVLLELPYGDPAYEIMAVFYAAHHRRPLINGYSGFFPRTYDARIPALKDPLADPPRASAVVAASGATHVLLHQAAFAGDGGRRIADWLVARGARPVTSAGSDTLFTLK